MALLALNYAIGFADPAPSCECDHCGRGVSDEMQFLQFVFAAVGFHGFRIFLRLFQMITFVMIMGVIILE